MAAAHSHVDIEEKKIQKSYFDVLGICCPSEVPLIESILKNLDGVKDVSVIVPTKTVIVLHDTLLISQLQIVKALNKARLEASVRVQGVKSYQKKWPSPFAIASGVLLVLSFLKYLYNPFQWLALGAVAFGIIPILFRAVTALRNLTFGDINILVVITVVGSVALKDYWEAGTIVFLFTISEWLESLVSHKATTAMSSLLNLVPQRAILAETGEEVDVSKVKLNTILAVKDGEVIPIDGVVIDGECEVDEKTLTGESFPVAKQKDSNVWAGTINVNGYISIKTTALAEDCVVARMTQLVEEAQSNRSRIQRYIEKFAMYYTPAIVVISAALAVVPAALRVHNEREWFHIALVVLVSACPCALILSTPVAMFCALTKAAKSGVFFKGANYLETLAKVKIMAFDKTGTVTRAEFEVTEFRSLSDDISLSTMLYWISSIESKSSHPMAAALVDFALSHSVQPKPEKVEQFQNFPGEGIYGKIDGKDVYIGNLRISLRAGCSSVPKPGGNFGEGNSVGFMFLGSTPAGIFSLADVCRTGADEALNELKSMGIKTVMLTGDSYVAAKHAQDKLGGALEDVHAELLPEDKARIVKDYQKVACTAMIGDGINDAPALATADIGISMGISGSALATETGHVILMTNDIQRIPKVARLSRRVRRKILENMILSVAIKGSILALAIAGHPIVWAAVLADVGTCLLVIFNSMLLLKGTKNYQKKCRRSSTVSLSDKQINKCSESDLSNARQPCCDVIEQKYCEVKTCSSMNCSPRHQSGLLSSSSSPCRSSNLSAFTEKRSCCGDGDGSKKGKCSDSRSYTNDAKPVGELDTHNRGQINCSKSIRRLGGSISVGKEQNDKSSECCLSHAQKPCCRDIKPQKCCEVQACPSKKCAPVQHSGALSSNSCGSDKYSDKVQKSCCGHSNRVPKAQFSDQGRCRSLSSNSCCSNFPDSTEKRNCCEQGNGIQKCKCSDSKSYNNDVKPKGELDTHGKSPGSHLSHTQKPCGYDIESQKNCEVLSCSSKNCSPVNQSGALSSSSCRNSKCSDSKDKESCCGHGNRNLKAKGSDHGCCSRDAEHKGPITPCHGEINCSNSSTSLGDGIVTSLNNRCRSSDPCSQLTSKNEVEEKNSPNYLKHDLITDQELGGPMKICCDLDQANNVHSSCENHAAECCPSYHSITDNLGGLNNAGCRARRTCVALEKRCVGGCCESFRKECCGGGQLGVSLRGSLSEIVIE